jgi:hypothetical protein
MMRLRRKEVERNKKRKRTTEEHRSDLFNCKAAELCSGDLKVRVFPLFSFQSLRHVSEQYLDQDTATSSYSLLCSSYHATLWILACDRFVIVNGQKGGETDRMKIRKKHE